MATPDFILRLREKIGHDELWLTGVTAVVVRETEGVTEVLMVQRSDTGAWTPVTGIVDPGEEPAVAAAREVLEEADVVAVPERLVSVHVTGPVVYENGDRSNYLDIVFRLTYVSGEPYPADGENTRAAWYPATDLPEVSADMRDRILVALENAPEARFRV